MAVFNETRMPELTAKHMSCKDIQREAAQHYNNHLSIRTIAYRVKRGWDLDRIEQTFPDRRFTYLYNGNYYTSHQLAQIAKDKFNNTLHSRTIRRRIGKGWAIQKAISTPSNIKLIRKQNSFLYHGKQYWRNQLVELAQKQYKQNGKVDSEMTLQLFAINLIDYVHNHNMSYAEFAKLLNMSPSSVSGYLTGGKVPNLLTVVYIANQLNLTLNDLTKVPNR